jgi:hypothetical protein
MTAYLIALLLFYADYTGKPAYTLLADNMYRDTSDCWIQPQHRVQWGDLNCDGIVNQADADLYNSIMPPFGWTVGGKVHWFRDCSYIKDKPVRACLIENNLCLRCAARRINND